MANRKKGAAKRKTARNIPNPTREIRTCFVLMPFKEPFNTYYREVYVPAIESAQLKPVRVDDLFRAGPIVKEIWESIVKAQMLLADLTDRNANVFYELGLAHAVGRPVILMTQNMDDVPFDLRHLRHLVYNTVRPAWAAELKTDLAKAISQTLEDPIAALAFSASNHLQQPRPARTSLQRATQKAGMPVGAKATTSSDLSAQQARQIFSALPARSKLKLMERAISGEELSSDAVMEVILDAMQPRDESV
jgi:hypothetical protein